MNNSDIRKRLFHIHYAAAGNSALVHALRQQDPDLQRIYRSPFTPSGRFRRSTVQQFYQRLQNIGMEEGSDAVARSGGAVITILDDDYPAQLKDLHTPPAVLYVKGFSSMLHDDLSLAVVGSRYPSAHALETMKDILAPLHPVPVTIVSGLARGIDTAAHVQAVQNNGRTIAVLGCGFNHVYPESSRSVQEYMGRSQLLVSEYPPDVRPEKWFFPQRNRIISGLSSAVFVVEAKERSGTLITAEAALELGRNVLALPGRITDPNAAGTNKLIQDGAGMVLRPEDVMEELMSAAARQRSCLTN
ncbi:DNA-processing protein DprA [Alkalicoccus chagannorensis]|uniref:DNA-processing protein DprA n=1 Tax=Alkalicoccus chagannorensis TaxID=427072 RepID=UPI00040E44B0|nr:DNA-processing protein DprA [Alkalicoccus chagannorensis]